MFDILTKLIALSETRPDAPAFSQGARTLSYGELSTRVSALSEDISQHNTTDGSIAIFAPNGLEWVVADLGLAHAGKTMVPLPTFFSHDQLRYIIQDAHVRHVLVTAETRARAQALGMAFTEITLNKPSAQPASAMASLRSTLGRSKNAQRIIYTSGTTGTPKGVRLGDRQISASARGLLAASGATQDDRYLSVLPFSLLLEQIAGICVPLLAGAPVTLAADAAATALAGDGMPLMKAFNTANASASVMVPGLLKAWVETMAATSNVAPKSLRFVAVGGAPINETLAQTAWDMGVPVYEGYGLSECCSVVSVNRPDDRAHGTVGKPITGVYVTLKNGEIIVHGNTVMSGYLGHDGAATEPGRVWPTGDLGAFAKNGALRILGRKDNLIVTQAGRNVSPEWVEDTCESHPNVAKAVLTLVPAHGLTLIVLPNPATADRTTIPEVLHEEFAKLPDYAKPDNIIVINAHEASENELFTPLGDVRRGICAAFAENRLQRDSTPMTNDVMKDSHDFL